MVECRVTTWASFDHGFNSIGGVSARNGLDFGFPDHENHEKLMLSELIKNNSCDVWNALEMNWSDFWCIWNDLGKFQEIMKFHSETTSPHSKWPLPNQIFCAGAQCFMFLLVSVMKKHGAKHSPPARGPFGGSDGQMARWPQMSSEMPSLKGTSFMRIT